MIKKQALKFTLLLLLASVSLHLSAQFSSGGDTPGIGGGGGGVPPTGGSPEVPLDNGLSVLLVLTGIGYAAIFENRNLKVKSEKSVSR